MTVSKKKGKLPREAGRNKDEARQFALEVAAFLDEKKLKDIRLLYLEGVNPYFRFFLIATAGSSVQLKTVVKDLKKLYSHHMPSKSSGHRPEDLDSGWVIVDFLDLIVHIFLQEERSYYNLERLWGDAEKIDL